MMNKDIYRLILEELSPKGFYTLSLVNRMTSETCLDIQERYKIKFSRVTTETSFDSVLLRTVLPNGKRHGPQEEYRSGVLMYQQYYKDGRLEGLMKLFGENGRLISIITWNNDQRHGPAKDWHRNGTLELDQNWVNGKKHGLEQWWYPDGELKSYVNWVDGLQEGIEESFYSSDHSGNLQSRQYWVKGKREGLEEIFNTDGTVHSWYQYENGELIDESEQLEHLCPCCRKYY